jgi:hypothetical protein
MKQINGKNLFNEDEFLEKLKPVIRHRVTLWRLRKRGKLTSYKIGGRNYYTDECADDLLEKSRTDAAA